MKNKISEANNLVKSARRYVISGNRKKLFNILDKAYIFFTENKNLWPQFMPCLMDIGNTYFSYHNHFVRYKSFKPGPAYIFLKKAMLQDNYDDFKKSLE